MLLLCCIDGNFDILQLNSLHSLSLLSLALDSQSNLSSLIPSLRRVPIGRVRIALPTTTQRTVSISAGPTAACTAQLAKKVAWREKERGAQVDGEHDAEN